MQGVKIFFGADMVENADSDDNTEAFDVTWEEILLRHIYSSVCAFNWHLADLFTSITG